jgi:hypothetical protein
MSKDGKFRTASPIGTCSIHDSVGRTGPVIQPAPSQSSNGAPNILDSRYYFFVLADEVLPSQKVVRKVLVVPATAQQVIAANPEIFGLHPLNPTSGVSIGQHALGDQNSPYTSASTNPKGAPNITGRLVFIDVEKAKAAGVRIFSTEEIVADLDRLARSDPSLWPRVEKLKNAITHVEEEVLLEGSVPKTAIKSAQSMKLTSGLRFVQAIGIGLTVYDLGKATEKSIEQKSYRPIAAEGIRQVGGWAAAVAGMKAGVVLGGAAGAPTGAGAILTGAAGAIVFGAAGYFGADWIADHIDEN